MIRFIDVHHAAGTGARTPTTPWESNRRGPGEAPLSLARRRRLLHVVHRVQQLAAQQRERRAPVGEHVVHGVGQDLGDPRDAGAR